MEESCGCICSILSVRILIAERFTEQSKMAAYSKDYRYSVEFNIHAVDAPGTRLTRTGDIYLNICMLGMHKRSRLLPPYLPMHVDQKLYFEKVSPRKMFS